MDFVQWLEQSWVYILAFGAGLASILNLSKNIKELKNNITKPFNDLKCDVDKLEEKVNDLEEVVESKAKHHDQLDDLGLQFQTQFKELNASIIALLRDRINSHYFDRCTDRGYIKPVEVEIVHSLYESYHALGGNGMISREMEILDKLPIFESQEKYDNWRKNKKKKAEDE